ncbi:MAG: hypothetical protein WBK51_08325 [Polaromonas sp.]
MIPAHVLEERKATALSRARPMTPEENASDLKMMEELYQEDLKRQAVQPPKPPSPEALEIAAKILANKAMRQQQEHQGKSSGTTQ